jgi:hypothetical protein
MKREGFSVIKIMISGRQSAATEPMQQRIARLRSEVIEICRLNREYPHITHTREVAQRHRARRQRLEQIVAELRILSTVVGIDSAGVYSLEKST